MNKLWYHKIKDVNLSNTQWDLHKKVVEAMHAIMTMIMTTRTELKTKGNNQPQAHNFRSVLVLDSQGKINT